MDTNIRKKISLLKKCATTQVEEDIYLDDFLKDIKDGKWSSYVSEGGTKSKDKIGDKPSPYTVFKSNGVPAVTIHGTFAYRADAGLKERNFIAALDYDHVPNIIEVIAKLRNDPYSYSIFRSFGADGICLLVKVDPDQPHDIAHGGLREYYNKKYELVCDEGAKDLSRLRAVSHDPNLWINENSLIWKTLDTWQPKKKSPLLPKDNHRGQIASLIGSRLAKGDTAEEVERLIATAHIDPVSCMNDPEEVKKLILDLQARYHEGREGKGIETVQYCGFWTNNFSSTEIQLSTGLLLDALIALGYSVLDSEYVQVRNGVIYKILKTELYATVIDLASFQEVTFQIKDKKISIGQTALKTRAQTALRGSVALFALPKFNREIMRDTAKQVYFHFKNLSMVVTAEGRKILTRDGSKCIFEKQVIPHDFNEPDEKEAEFSVFTKNIAGNNLDAFRSSIGYTLRNYNGSDGMRAIWLCDRNYKAGKNNGRSGKSLFRKAISRMRKTDECSGKEWDEKSQFKFQNMSRDTQVYAIEDIQPGFYFNVLFTTCTEGIEYQAKHRDRVKLTMEETPKIVITANRPPKIEDGSSMMGRLIILPVTSFYVPYTPQGGVKHVHGHTFFDDWDRDEWDRFYGFAAQCAEEYLRNGLANVDMTEIRKNRFRELSYSLIRDGQTVDDLVEWIYAKELNGEIDPTVWRDEFNEHTGDGAIEQTAFGKLLKSFLDIEGTTFIKKRTGPRGETKTLYFISK